MDSLPADDAGTTDQEPASEENRVYLVPYRWWRGAQDLGSENGVSNVARGIPYTALPSPSLHGGRMRIINTIFNSDLVFSLRRDDCLMMDGAEEAVSGRNYALIPTDMWSQALWWHKDANGGNQVFHENSSIDVYPLKLRISVMRDTSVITVRISKKDNAIEGYKRAFKIFSVESDTVVHIYDFSGQANLIMMNEWNRQPLDGQRLVDHEVSLDLQLYTRSEYSTCRNEWKKEDFVQKSRMCYGGLILSNGSITQAECDLYFGTSKGYVSFGLIGLENLGNTCFMNSAVQCLAHTPRLAEYFLGEYISEINDQNSLGMGGELALAFGELLRKLSSSNKIPVVPRDFKAKLSRFAPQFSGFNQHDSQTLKSELLKSIEEYKKRVKIAKKKLN